MGKGISTELRLQIFRESLAYPLVNHESVTKSIFHLQGYSPGMLGAAILVGE